jgi:hypothetical protein
MGRWCRCKHVINQSFSISILPLKHVDSILCQYFDASYGERIPGAREGIFFGLVKVSGYIKPF